MKKNGLASTHMSPCLRLFIESLLDGVAVERRAEEMLVASEGFALQTSYSSYSSNPPLGSDTNCN